MRYFREADGKVFAIVNARTRRSENDVIVTQALDAAETRLYEQLKKEGKTDSAVFRALFPPTIPPVAPLNAGSVTVEIGNLTKAQLVALVLQELATDLPSLGKLTARDLRAMFLALRRIRQT